MCLRTKTLIIHPLKHLAFWGAFFSCLLCIFGILKSICSVLCVSPPGPEYVMDASSTICYATYSKCFAGSTCSGCIRPANQPVGLSLRSPVALRLARRVEREAPIKKKVYSKHFPKNNLAIHPLLVKLEKNCSWINTSNHVSASLQIIELKVKQLHPCRNYSSATQELLKSK